MKNDHLCLPYYNDFYGKYCIPISKRASGSNGLKSLLFNQNLYIGGILYLFSAVLNIWILRFLDYSVVLPLTSLTYVWTMVVSYLVLKEKIARRKIAGVLFVLVGAVIVSIR